MNSNRPVTQKQSKRRNWDPEDMIRAVAAVKNKEMGFLKASKSLKLERINKKKNRTSFADRDRSNKPQLTSKCKPSTSTKSVFKNTSKPKKAQKRRQSSSSSSDDELLILKDDSDDEFVSETDDAECFVCFGLFSEDMHDEDWVRCKKCFKWGHEKCTDFKKSKHFICSDCID